MLNYLKVRLSCSINTIAFIVITILFMPVIMITLRKCSGIRMAGYN